MKLAPVFERLLDGWKAQGYALVAMRELADAVNPRALPLHTVVRCAPSRAAPAPSPPRARPFWPKNHPHSLRFSSDLVHHGLWLIAFQRPQPRLG